MNKEKRPLKRNLGHPMLHFCSHAVVTVDCPLRLSLICVCSLHYWFLNLTFKSKSKRKNEVNMSGIVVALTDGNVKGVWAPEEIDWQ